LGAASEAAAATGYVLTVVRAQDLRERDPYRVGFLSANERYLHTQDSVAPLAAAGAVAMTAAVALGPRAACRGTRPLAWVALVAATGLIAGGTSLAVLEPGRIGDTQTYEPGRQTGALLASVGLPLLTYGARWLWTRRDPVRAARCSQADDPAR
jgi:hypothetical protein